MRGGEEERKRQVIRHIKTSKETDANHVKEKKIFHNLKLFPFAPWERFPQPYGSVFRARGVRHPIWGEAHGVHRPVVPLSDVDFVP